VKSEKIKSDPWGELAGIIVAATIVFTVLIVMSESVPTSQTALEIIVELASRALIGMKNAIV